MGTDPTRQILDEYRSKLQLNEEFGGMLERLIRDLLRAAGIKVHSVEHRIKEEPSLARKLSGRAYGRLADVTDVCGVRIVTYFADDVDKVAAVIETEFSIDRANSVDKRTAMDPHQFGYLSVHYIVSLGPTRASLTEYSSVEKCVAEVQIRSVLQHAWAEIEHDLGYKSASGVPRDAIRQFSRMAGLLEVADDGFVELRQRLSAYQGEVNAKIGDKPNELLIDAVSLKALIESDGNIQKADELINVSFNNRIGVMSIELIAPHAAAASVLGFRTIGELNAGFQRNMPRTVQFASAHLKAHAKALGVPTQVMARGTSILSFLVLTAMEKSGIGLLEKAYPDWKQQPVESYKRILGTIQEGFDSLKSQ